MRPHRLRANNEGWLTSYADLITNLLIFFVLIISASSIQTGKMAKIIEAMSQSQPVESLARAAEEVRAELARQGISADATAELTDDGLEVVFNSGVTFASGSAEILPAMHEPLAKVLAVVKPYTDKYHVAVEGHTDERPISTAAYRSNWELASARAMSIREELEAIGVDSRRLRIESYADNKPLKLEGEEQVDRETYLAKQRRVVIRLF